RNVVPSHRRQSLAVETIENPGRSPTEPARRFEDRLDYDFDPRWGSSDDPQHLGSGGLLLQGLADLAVTLLKLGVPPLQLLEQPGVLDGDDRLVRERLQQRDLGRGVRFRDRSAHRDVADTLALSDQGNVYRRDWARWRSRKLGAERR